MATVLPPTGDPTTDTENLQNALDNYDYVEIEGVYTHTGLTLSRLYQTVVCKGANLIPADANATITINARGVTLRDWRIHTSVAANKLLHINQGLCTLDNLQIEAGNALIGVEITNATGTKFIGGEIKGNSGATKTATSAGLHVGQGGGYEIRAFGLHIHHWETGVRISSGGSIDDPHFSGCSFENNSLYGFQFDPPDIGVIYNLNLYGCHFEGSPTFIDIGANGRVLAGVIDGCRFGAGERVIKSVGGLNAVVVSNCYSKLSAPAGTEYVFDLGGVQVLRVINSQNIWDGWQLATGSHADKLTSLDAVMVLVA